MGNNKTGEKPLMDIFIKFRLLWFFLSPSASKWKRKTRLQRQFHHFRPRHWVRRQHQGEGEAALPPLTVDPPHGRHFDLLETGRAQVEFITLTITASQDSAIVHAHSLTWFTGTLRAGPSLTLFVTPVLFMLWQVKMSAVKRVYGYRILFAGTHGPPYDHSKHVQLKVTWAFKVPS